MAFKIKDLTIHLPTHGRVIPDNTCTGCARSNPAPVLSMDCGFDIFRPTTLWATLTPLSFGCPPPSPEGSLATLTALKEQLKQQLLQVERQEAEIEKEMMPQTVEEVDMLTAKLTEALTELKARRADLVKNPKPAPSK